MNKKRAIGLCNCKCGECENHKHENCEFNCDNRKYIISQGCCPNCYSPEPCSCEDDFNDNFAGHLEEIKKN